MLQKFTRIGQIVGAFGLRGQVKVLPMTDYVERFEAGVKLRLNDSWVEVETFSMHKGRPLIKLKGVDDKTEADKLQWGFLESDADFKPELEEDEFRTEDLIGLVVVTVDGEKLGPIDDVLAMPAHDVIKVGELLIPAVHEFVKDVDFDAGTMTVQLIPGMLE